MKNDLRIDFAKNEIIMSRSFEKCASIAGSEEYRRLQAVRLDYPTFVVVRRSIKKAPSKQAYAGLTYSYMEAYIAGHDQDGAIKKVYDELRLIGACHKVSYPTIKKWFLETYTEVAEFCIREDAPNQENNSDVNKVAAEDTVEAA